MRFLLAALLLACVVSMAQAAPLAVTVEGIRSAKGNIRLSVYGAAAEWPDKSRSENERVEKAQAGSVVFRFDLPPGIYAINGFHDENGNGKFDTSLICRRRASPRQASACRRKARQS